jgi:hypothetical protein
MNLQLYKGKYVGAKKGYDLLKSKADALKVIMEYFTGLRICCDEIMIRRQDSEKSVKLSTAPKLAWLIAPPRHSSVSLRPNMLQVHRLLDNNLSRLKV